MKESIIEKEGVRYAEARGWEVYKFASPGHPGVHDRLHFKNGIAFTIEYKATGEKASPKQREEALRLARAGIVARCCDSVTKARLVIDTMDFIAESNNPILDSKVLAAKLSSFNP